MMSSRERAKRALENIWRRQGLRRTFALEGNSMGAALPAGATVMVCFSETPQLKRGVIIYFRCGTQRIAHRLLAHMGPLCIEKGDANLLPRFLLRRHILGIVKETSIGD